MNERGSWAPAAWRKAAMAERRKVGLLARVREMCVFRRGWGEDGDKANREGRTE